MMVTATEGNGRARQLSYVENALPYQYEYFPSSFLAFTPDELSVINVKFTDIETYVKEMRDKFITGVNNVGTDWDEYVATVKKMGIDEVLAVYQAAYDRWNKL
jgi:putative aldouronate transport system substrate-binding protein